MCAGWRIYMDSSKNQVHVTWGLMGICCLWDSSRVKQIPNCILNLLEMIHSYWYFMWITCFCRAREVHWSVQKRSSFTIRNEEHRHDALLFRIGGVAIDKWYFPRTRKIYSWFAEEIQDGGLFLLLIYNSQHLTLLLQVNFPQLCTIYLRQICGLGCLKEFFLACGLSSKMIFIMLLLNRIAKSGLMSLSLVCVL